MQFEHEPKPRFPKIRKGSGFYLALGLAVVAAAVGTWGAVTNSLRNNPYQIETTQRSTINWENYATHPLEPETEDVGRAATSVPDQREVTTAAPKATKPDNAPYTGTFAMPFGTRIVKDYSDGEMVKSATMGDWRVHNGVDFAGEIESEVVAIQSGVVKSVIDDPMWGIVAAIDHGGGLVARYCGLSENSTPREGQKVEKGEPIGFIAQVPSEAADGIHLHLETLVGGKAADPLAVMNKNGEN